MLAMGIAILHLKRPRDEYRRVSHLALTIILHLKTTQHYTILHNRPINNAHTVIATKAVQYHSNFHI